MKATVLAAASALVIAPITTYAASAAPSNTGGSWSFTDYTPDLASLAADDVIYLVAGRATKSYCHGSRFVPSAPQDQTVRRVRIGQPSVLQLHLNSTGAWGLDVENRKGVPVAALSTTKDATAAPDLEVRLRPGSYVVRSRNLGGAPTARVDYRITRAH